MDLEKRKRAFVELGNYLQNLSEEEFQNWYIDAKRNNAWFTEDSVRFALKGIRELLKENELASWLSNYSFPSVVSSKRVGVVMAGNIPMVGFHDFLCVLLSGHHVVVKMSSNDNVLLKKLTEKLVGFEREFAKKVEFVEKLQDVDAVIATGSDNSAKYFHYYFSKIPHIIRQNRVSVAILTGNETQEDLESLSLDILMYFGMGCRNVAKIYAPVGYDFNHLLKASEKYHKLVDFNKYYNNYDYNKSICIVNNMPCLDNGFLILIENEAMASPVSVVYYEYYQSEAEVTFKIESQKEKIQTIVTKGEWYSGSVDFGKAQTPSVSDYADGIDTMEFLLKLSK